MFPELKRLQLLTTFYLPGISQCLAPIYNVTRRESGFISITGEDFLEVTNNADHQQADWVGIHERICQMLVPIRTMKDMYDPSVRKKNQLRKRHLIKICTLVAQSKLSEGKGEEALPAAHCCLQTSIDLYGPNTIQLVPAYILLAEANMGLGNLAVVAELLSQAEWAVLKNPELGASIQQQLHRSLGQFYTTTGNLETALFHFANDIYFACEEYGLDSSATTKGYFLIADVFARQGKTLIVHSLYSEVAERWHKHLSSLLETHQKHADSSVDSSVSFYGSGFCQHSPAGQPADTKT
ncbi:zinc finger MYND domain-containing protein 12 isoform X3 [Xiphophorus couchianus]|uniref:zinc finger MYND domain-containing protein 12 isoform X3 n=1 Tax=Xiphophorus couchianus TaxID=32473 RepID=UPI00101631E0|nr:zinc finger MYND domain-containing protein 12 isoform X3 [Xiphophorus couchianus]